MSTNDPQLTDGYTPLANPILEALAHVHLTGREWQVLLVIFRKTYGWSKRSDLISLSQFVDGTGLSKSHVCDALASLEQRHMISTVIPEIGKGKPTMYAFNKHSGEWRGVPKSGTFPKSGMQSFPKSGHTTTRKDTTTRVLKEQGDVPKIGKGLQDDTDPVQDAVALWRAVCVPAGMHNLRDVEPLRDKIMAAWHRLEASKAPDWIGLATLDRFQALFAKAAQSPFLKGLNDRKWAADLAFVLRPASVERIMTGYYDHTGTTKVAVHVNPSPASAFSADGRNDRIRVEQEDQTPKEW